MTSKTVFLSCFHSLMSRNILQTPVLSGVLKCADKVVILVPINKQEYYTKQFGSSQIIIEGVEVGPSIRTLRVGMLKRLAEALPNTARAAMGRKLTLSGTQKNKLYYYLFYVPASILGKSRFIMHLLRRVDYYLSPRGRFYPLFDKYSPSLIFATDVQNEHDVALMQDAYAKSLQIIGMVRSWDNLVTRAFRFVPRKLIVHNEIIKEQAVKLYGINADSITVTGVPHYDRYLKGPTIPREIFLKNAGLNPAKKTILFFPLCDYRVVHKNKDGEMVYMDQEILTQLSDIDANIIVRFSPNETVTIPGFKKPDNYYFDHPGYTFDNKVVTNREVTAEDDMRLINELSHSDIVLSGPSTTAIDAALFDKPIIFINFQGKEKVKGIGQIFEYASEHIVNILKTGGSTAVENKDELLSGIKQYFNDPKLHHEGRKQIVSEQCFKTDGQSSSRVVSEICRLCN